MALLAAKILLAPLCVVAVSLAARRWGLAVAGVLGGLPVVAGPILLVETVQHGSDFGAAAASGSLLGLIGLSAFAVVYGCAAMVPTKPLVSLSIGWAAFLLAVALLDPVHLPAIVSLLLAGGSFALGIRILPDPPASGTAPLRPGSWDLPARALAAAILVLVLTGVSEALGPHLSGLLAPFPIITSVLAFFSHREFGAERTIVLLRNFLRGFYGFAAFCFTLAVALPAMPPAASFGLAAAAAVAVQLAFAVAVGMRTTVIPRRSPE